MEKRLSELKIKEAGIVKNVACEASVKRRLSDMGLLAGVKVRVIRFAPLGDPMQIEIRGYSLALRKLEADNIIVEVV
ncbi:MAG: ferrous iron transport protein A [Acholeplasmatales bacterium]|nr:ferrous iron transport protein A [Acholeplasmatales bacterium]